MSVREIEIKESQFVLHMCPRLSREANFLSYESLLGICFPQRLMYTRKP